MTGFRHSGLKMERSSEYIDYERDDKSERIQLIYSLLEITLRLLNPDCGGENLEI
jgi:hypothetical protein